MFMYFRKSNKVREIGNVTLMTRVTGFEELLSDMFDQDPRSLFVTESTWPTWGIPLPLTYLSVFA